MSVSILDVPGRLERLLNDTQVAASDGTTDKGLATVTLRSLFTLLQHGKADAEDGNRGLKLLIFFDFF